MIDQPLPTFDQSLLALSLSQCDSQIQTHQQAESISAQVRSLLVHSLGQAPALSTIAAELGLNERTLRRRLTAEGTSYSKILSTLRCDKAKRLLASTPITIDDLAYQLGYSSPSTFKRLFKQWQGESPGAYRKRQVMTKVEDL